MVVITTPCTSGVSSCLTTKNAITKKMSIFRQKKKQGWTLLCESDTLLIFFFFFESGQQQQQIFVLLEQCFYPSYSK